MSFSAREMKAIGYAARLRGWRPTLSYKPWVYFHVSTEGDDVTQRLHLTAIMQEYEAHLRTEARQRARQLSRGVL